VTGTPSAYFLWQQTIAWSADDDQSAQGDPDGDGTENLLEFALGLDPLIVDTAGLPVATIEGNSVIYDFNNPREGITYEVQISSDLVSWSEPPFATLTSSSVTPIEIPLTEENEDRTFIRLRVSE